MFNATPLLVTWPPCSKINPYQFLNMKGTRSWNMERWMLMHSTSHCIDVRYVDDKLWHLLDWKFFTGASRQVSSSHAHQQNSNFAWSNLVSIDDEILKFVLELTWKRTWSMIYTTFSASQAVSSKFQGQIYHKIAQDTFKSTKAASSCIKENLSFADAYGSWFPHYPRGYGISWPTLLKVSAPLYWPTTESEGHNSYPGNVHEGMVTRGIDEVGLRC